MKRQLIGGFVLVSSGLCLAAAIVSFLYANHFVRSASRATGTVVQLVQQQTENSTSFCPVFSFVDAQGKTQTIYSTAGSYPPAYAVGSIVPVLYDAHNPTRAEIDSFFSIWGIPVVTGSIGIIYLPVGLVIWFWPAIIRRVRGR